MNYLAFFPENTWMILLCDRLSGTRDNTDKKQIFAELQRLPQFENKNLDDMYKKTEKKYYFKWFVGKIYNEPTARSMHVLYRHTSHSSHPSLIRPHNNYEPQITASEILDLKLLLFYNILAEVEGHRHMIEQKKFPINETKTFIDEILPQIHTNGMMTSFFPDHPNIVSKVLIHPPNKPWE